MVVFWGGGKSVLRGEILFFYKVGRKKKNDFFLEEMVKKVLVGIFIGNFFERM